MRTALVGALTWWLGAAAGGGVFALAACSAPSEHILPGPSTGARPVSAGGSATSSSGGSPASGGADAAGGGGTEPAACAAPTPDRCPVPSGGMLEGCVSMQDDPSNCGSCGAACEPQAACVAGKCGEPPQELTKSTKCGAVRIAVLGAQLFWTEPHAGRVRTMSVKGAGVSDIATAEANPGRIAVDESGVYWVDSGDGSSGSSKLMKAALPLGDAPVALRTAPATDPFVGVAVDSGKVYYGLGPEIHAISTDPSDLTDVVVGVSFARNDTMMPDGVPDGLSFHDGRVYWVVSDVGSVESDDLLPGPDHTARVGHSGQLWPNDLGFAGDYVYYAAFSSLYAAQTNTPAIAVASSPSDSELAAFAVTDTDGYFADQGGSISRHGLALPAAPDFQPTPSVSLVRDQGNVTSLVLDSARIYWASVDPTSGDCALRALAF